MKVSFIVLVCLFGVLAAAPTEKESRSPAVQLANGEQHIPVEVRNLNEADVRAEAEARKPKKRETKAADAPKVAAKEDAAVKPPAEAAAPVKAAEEAKPVASAPKPAESKAVEVKADAPKVAAASAAAAKTPAPTTSAPVPAAASPSVTARKAVPAAARGPPARGPAARDPAALSAPAPTTSAPVSTTSAPASTTSAPEPTTNAPEPTTNAPAAETPAPTTESKPEPAVETTPTPTTESATEPATEKSAPASGTPAPASKTPTDNEVELKVAPVAVQGRAARVNIEAEPSKKSRSGKKYSDIQIVQMESEVSEDGKYSYQFESEDGIVAAQQGELKKIDEEHSGESVKGGYSYTDEDGQTFSLTYTADENGYRPVGAHLPVGPTIPPAIARALAWQATAKPWVDPWVVEQEMLRKAREGKAPVKRAVRRV